MKPDVTLAASTGSDKGVVQVYKWAAGTATGTMTFVQSGNGTVPVCGSLPTVTMTTQ
jgi:hypothetical protein